MGTVEDGGASPLYGFLDFAAAQTPCANPDAFGLTVDQRSDRLKIGLEDPLSLIIGMADIMARLAPFATEIACKSHGILLYQSNRCRI